MHAPYCWLTQWKNLLLPSLEEMQCPQLSSARGKSECDTENKFPFETDLIWIIWILLRNNLRKDRTMHFSRFPCITTSQKDDFLFWNNKQSSTNILIGVSIYALLFLWQRCCVCVHIPFVFFELFWDDLGSFPGVSLGFHALTSANENSMERD